MMTGGLNMSRDLGLLLPEIALLLTAVAVLTTGMLRRHALALPTTLAGLGIAVALTIPLLDSNTTVFMDTYRVDDLSVWAKLILLPATALIAVLAVPEVRGTDREATVYTLFTLATFGALALAGAGDILFIVIGVLLTSLATFGLVAYPRDNRATEAAMKYFVFGSVSGAVMIFGLTYWYGASGSTLLAATDAFRSNWPAAAASLIAVFVGLGYKAGLAPFHFWAPDAYDGGPLVVAAYLSVVPKIGAIFGLAQIARDLPPGLVNWELGLAAIATLSMTYGNLAALPQTNVVRLLAYSSIAQSGYLLLGVVAIGGSDLALNALIVFAAAYAAMNIGMFAVVSGAGSDLASYQGLGRTFPWVGIAAVVFLLSLVGLPPLAGFVGKLLLFGAAIDSGYSWLAVVAILNSVLSLAVYLRIIVPMYASATATMPVQAPSALVRGLAFALTIGIGIWAEVLF